MSVCLCVTKMITSLKGTELSAVGGKPDVENTPKLYSGLLVFISSLGLAGFGLVIQIFTLSSRFQSWFYITSAHSCRVNWGRPLWKGPLCRVHSPLAKSSASAFNRSYRQHLKDIHWGFPLWKTPLCRVHSFVPNARSSTALVGNLHHVLFCYRPSTLIPTNQQYHDHHYHGKSGRNM